VYTSSTFDAASLFVLHAKENPGNIPKPTTNSVFEVVVDGKIHHVQGKAVQRWILPRQLSKFLLLHPGQN
jgi:hypothetical protein